VRLEDLDLLWLDLARNNSRHVREAKPRRFKTGYRHMCRFQTSRFFELPAFSSVRYLMHLDTDATLSCKPDGPDPIVELVRGGSVYGLFEVGVEDPSYTEGWSGFLEEYMLLHEVEPQVPRPLLMTDGFVLTKEAEDHPGQLINVTADPMAVTWGTAWEVLDLSFFNSPRVLEFSRKVERSLGHYRHNWGDHLIRAYQVMLFAPLSQVLCFDKEDLPGQHGCGGIEEEYGSHNVFHFIEGLACPNLWSSEFLRGVPWTPPGGSPAACLEVCNQVEACEGFDLAYSEEEKAADCAFRLDRATKEACLGEGAEGAAGEAWAAAREDGRGALSFVGAANRFQLIERSLERTLSCEAWMAGLEAKLTRALEPAAK